MAERAAHLVDHVLPDVPLRQWVLSLPHRLRYVLAWDHDLCRAVAGVYVRAVLDGSHRGKGATYVQYAGLCLETQKFPNAIDIPDWQDQVILRSGQPYRHVMIHTFSAEP